MYYYGYRFYDPGLQRWVNRDPIEEAGGIDLYIYVDNSPIDQLDPNGESPLIPIVAIGIWLFSSGCKDAESIVDPPVEQPTDCWGRLPSDKLPKPGVIRGGSCLAMETGCIDCCNRNFRGQDWTACVNHCQDKYNECIVAMSKHRPKKGRPRLDPPVDEKPPYPPRYDVPPRPRK
jgi:hypothetical protein